MVLLLVSLNHLIPFMQFFAYYIPIVSYVLFRIIIIKFLEESG